MIAPPRPPRSDELELLIKEARDRQRRRRRLAAAGVALLAGLGLGAYAVAGGFGSQPAAQSTRGSGIPPCRSSQLSASSSWNGAAGTVMNFFTILNRGGSACSLPLARPVVLLTSRGSRLRIHERSAASHEPYPGRPVRLLGPGRKADVWMDWSNWCVRPNTRWTETITLVFKHGLQVTARDVSGQPACLNPTQPSELIVSRPLTPPS
jgi:hypothetical protein